MKIPQGITSTEFLIKVNHHRAHHSSNILSLDYELQKYFQQNRSSSHKYSINHIYQQCSMRKLHKIIIKFNHQIQESDYLQLMDPRYTSLFCIVCQDQKQWSYHFRVYNQVGDRQEQQQQRIKAVRFKDCQQSKQLIVFLSQRPIIIDQCKKMRDSHRITAYQFGRTIYLWGFGIKHSNKDNYALIRPEEIEKNGNRMVTYINNEKQGFEEIVVLGSSWKPRYKEDHCREKSRSVNWSLKEGTIPQNLIIVYTIRFKEIESEVNRFFMDAQIGITDLKNYENRRSSIGFNRNFSTFKKYGKGQNVQKQKDQNQGKIEQKQKCKKKVQKFKEKEEQCKQQINKMTRISKNPQHITVDLIKCQQIFPFALTPQNYHTKIQSNIDHLKQNPIFINQQFQELSSKQYINIYVSNQLRNNQMQYITLQLGHLTRNCVVLQSNQPQQSSTTSNKIMVIQKNNFNNQSDFVALELASQLLSYLSKKQTSGQCFEYLQGLVNRSQLKRNGHRIRLYLDLLHILISLNIKWIAVCDWLILKSLQVLYQQLHPSDASDLHGQDLEDISIKINRLSLIQQENLVAYWYQCFSHHLAYTPINPNITMILCQIFINNSYKILSSELSLIYLPQFLLMLNSISQLNGKKLILLAMNNLIEYGQQQRNQHANLLFQYYLNLDESFRFQDMLRKRAENQDRRLLGQHDGLGVDNEGLGVDIGGFRGLLQGEFGVQIDKNYVKAIDYANKDWGKQCRVKKIDQYLNSGYLVKNPQNKIQCLYKITLPQQGSQRILILPQFTIHSYHFSVTPIFQYKQYQIISMILKITQAPKIPSNIDNNFENQTKFVSLYMQGELVLTTPQQKEFITVEHSYRGQGTHYQKILIKDRHKKVGEVTNENTHISFRVTLFRDVIHGLTLDFIKSALQTRLKYIHTTPNKYLNAKKRQSRVSQLKLTISQQTDSPYIYHQQCFSHQKCQYCLTSKNQINFTYQQQQQNIINSINLYQVPQNDLMILLKSNKLQIAEQQCLFLFVVEYYHRKIRNGDQKEKIRGDLFGCLRYCSIDFKKVLRIVMKKPFLGDFQGLVEIIRVIINRRVSINYSDVRITPNYKQRTLNTRIIKGQSQTPLQKYKKQSQIQKEPQWETQKLILEIMKSSMGQKFMNISSRYCKS